MICFLAIVVGFILAGLLAVAVMAREEPPMKSEELAVVFVLWLPLLIVASAMYIFQWVINTSRG